MTLIIVGLLGLLCMATACTEAEKPQPTLTREELMNPETCKDCHPKHYAEWKSSMHAYASEDPVFRAMNAQGQEDTDGGLGDFCVKCHAPLAAAEGYFEGSSDLDDVPEHLQGVTCYFCHNAVDVIGEHNATIKLANDTTMRGAIVDPVRPSAHGVAFSRFQDRFNPESSRMCGSCHDIETPNGVHLERTFAEYKESAYSAPGAQFLACSSCHMSTKTGLAAVDPDSDVRERQVSAHLWPGVDIALTPWSNRDAYKRAVECALSNSIGIWSFTSAGGIFFTVEYANDAGHRIPSGASQDRRLWIEFVAYDENDAVICSHGAVPDGEAAVGFVDARQCGMTSGTWLFRDRIFDADGNETHMFWRAAKSDMFPMGFQSITLPQPIDFGTPHTITTEYTTPAPPAKVTVRMRMRPMDFDVLSELVEAEYLDEALLEQIPTFDLQATVVTWRASDGVDEIKTSDPPTLDCESYKCAYDPHAPGCEHDAGTP